jgi:Dolichyl-phosphate-mannose-protein mannosyltransferase
MSEPPQNSSWSSLEKRDSSITNLSLLAMLTVFAVLIMGYHPGLEDDAFYLAAIKRNLNPALFPHDAEFFRLQFQATVFDKLIALSVRLTHLPLAWTVLLWQCAAIFLLLHGCWRISRRCFIEPAAQWASVTTIATLLTLPLPGIAISLADQYLHPRTLATAAILAAIVAVIDRRPWLAGILLAIAFVIHAIMASFGISFCAFLFWNQRVPLPRGTPGPLAALLPLGWIFEPASDAWRQAAATRGFYFPTRWHWYEWLGVIAPLILLYSYWTLLKRGERSAGNAAGLPLLVSSLLYYGAFQTAVGLLVMLPPKLERLRPFEPMRYLHLLYLLFFLIVGGLLGRYLLDRRVYRWLLLFFPLSVGMFYAQRQIYPASAHLELPGLAPQNGWLQAFAWTRQNTPVDSLFALDPHYMTLPGEDYHGFRALAERSALADYEKDAGMAARVPRLAPRWLREVNAQNGWQNFQAADFQRLKQEFGVTWVILYAQEEPRETMTCPYQNGPLQVCRLY